MVAISIPSVVLERVDHLPLYGSTTVSPSAAGRVKVAVAKDLYPTERAAGPALNYLRRVGKTFFHGPSRSPANRASCAGWSCADRLSPMDGGPTGCIKAVPGAGRRAHDLAHQRR